MTLFCGFAKVISESDYYRKKQYVKLFCGFLDTKLKGIYNTIDGNHQEFLGRKKFNLEYSIQIIIHFNVLNILHML